MSDREDTTTARVQRWRGGASQTVTDEIAREEPLEIRVGGRAVSVTMRTPGHDAELAVGFLASEGLIISPEDVVAARPLSGDPTCNTIEVELRPGVEIDLERLTRHVFASSSCGLCGKATIASVRAALPPIDSDLRVDAAVVLTLPERLRAAQAAFARTGGLHAAAAFTPTGELVVAREDVGRHNAVDKALGWSLLAGRDRLRDLVLLVSGRASFEIMQKALAARVPLVAAVSAPSSLAVDFARECNQTLVGFVRDDGMNLYAGAERVRFSASPTQRGPERP